MKIIAKNKGALVYLRQEGRGIGIINKLKAYQLQDTGLNTIDANLHLGLDVDSRDYTEAIEILGDLGINKVNLITNNPLKLKSFESSGLEIENRIPILINPVEQNVDYLKTKKNLMGHMLEVK